MRMMQWNYGWRSRILWGILVGSLGWAPEGYAQANACDPTIPAQTIPYAPGVTRTFFVSPSHTQTNVDMSSVVVDYLGEIFVAGQAAVVTNWTIPKTELMIVAGVPANCYELRLPEFKQLLQTNFYVVRITARGQPGTVPGVSAASSDRFFVPGAPGPVGMPRLRPPLSN